MPDDAVAMGPSTLPYCDIVQLRECRNQSSCDYFQSLGDDALSELLRLSGGLGDDEFFPSVHVDGGD